MENKQANAPAPAESPAAEKPARFNNLVTILILLTTVWTAYIAYIQSVDGDRQGDAARDSQLASLQAMTAYSSAIQRNSFEAKLLARYDDLAIEAAANQTSAEAFSEAGDPFAARQSNAAAERLLKARDTIRPFSPAFTDTRILDEQQRPDLSVRAPELFEQAYRAEENQIVLSKKSSAVAVKSDAYVLMITLAAVALFLLGLSLTVSTNFVRVLFVGLGTLMVAGSAGWFVVIRGAPEPSLAEEAVASFAQARVAYDKGNYDESIKLFGSAIDAAGNPLGYARAHLFRGQAESAKEDYASAVADFSKAIEQGAGADAYSARGWAYVALDDHAKAEADFKRAVALSPDSDDDLYSLGWAQYLSGNFAASIDNTRKAIAINGQYPAYHFNLGVALLASGDVAGAKDAYKAGLDLTQNKPVDLVGWQLQGAVDDLQTLTAAPSAKLSAEANTAVADWLTQLNTRLAEVGGQIDNVTFSSGIDGDEPADKLTVFEPGTTEVHVFIDFSGFVDGALWSDVWFINGEKIDELATEKAAWDAGDEGAYHFTLSTTDAGLAPGEYKVDLRMGDKTLRTASFRVRPTDAQFGEVVFAESVDESGEYKNPGYSFEAGIKDIYAVFDFANMTDNLKWSALWWHEDTEIDTGMAAAPTWTLGSDGTTYVTLSNVEPLPAGEYTLVLLVEGDVFQEGSFKVIEPSDLFGEIAFGAQIDASGNVITPAESIPAGAQMVYAAFDYDGLQNGQTWTAAWYLDGQLISHSEQAWRGGASGSTWVVLSQKEGSVPGQYDLELSVDGKVVQTGSVAVE